MTAFAPVLERALARAGGTQALEEMLPAAKDARALRRRGDDRYLSQMSLRIFRAGLRHAMVDDRWPAFEAVFKRFEPRRVVSFSDEDVEALMGDKRLIRHWAKLRSVRDNAAAMVAIAEAHGSFGAYLADWDASDTVGLWADLGKRFSQLGGASGPRFLRMVGKDTFVLTPDVVRALAGLGVVQKKPTAKRDLAVVQSAFNGWAEETGRELCQLSRILALSLG